MLIKICKECGKEFEANTSKKYCNREHYRKCEICGNSFLVPNHRLYDKTITCCSKQCSNIKRSKAIKVAQSKLDKGWYKPKTEYINTCVGCGKKFKTNIYNRKLCPGKHYKTCEICGKSFYVKNSNWYNKSSTCSLKCSQAKTRDTMINNYGVPYYALTDEWKDRVKNLEAITNKNRKQTNFDLFGTSAYSNTPEWLKDHMSNPDKLDNILAFIDNPIKYISDNFKTKPTVKMLSESIGINESSTLSRIHKFNIEEYIAINYSHMETEIVEYIKQCNDKIEIIRNDRYIISPYELDIYLPEFKLAIECNPTSTHNSTYHCFSAKEDPLPVNYHYNKTKLCEDKGIQLLHIFGYEWTHKKDIIKSIISNLIGNNDIIIYARKCEIREVQPNIAKQFLKANHRQGNANASVKLGLYYDEELVSLMTFSKSRHTIGKKDDSMELVRFCSTLNTTIVGGASKLFKYFINNYEFNYIKSYSDKAHTTGNLYKILGFNKSHESGPGYVWVKESTDVAYNRVNAQKHNIKNFLNDENIDLTKSESQIMKEHGFVKVYDSGTICWEYKKSP